MRKSKRMAVDKTKIISGPVIEAMRPENIGHRLQLLRVMLGKTKSEMADTLGIQRQYWSRFELGQRPVTNHVAAALFERYGVTMDWLILGRAQTLPVEIAEKLRKVEVSLGSSETS